MNIILDGNRMNTVKEFHRVVSEMLGFPDYYGNNLDALWDCLTGWIEPPITIIWKDFEISKKNLGDFADKAKLIFEDAEKEIDGLKIDFS